MKKQINFSDESTAYRFTLEAKNTVFEICKDTLVFSSENFYKIFFQGLEEKPEYELVNSGEELKGQAKHVFDTVAAILKKACESIDASWFEESDKKSNISSNDPCN